MLNFTTAPGLNIRTKIKMTELVKLMEAAKHVDSDMPIEQFIVQPAVQDVLTFLKKDDVIATLKQHQSLFAEIMLKTKIKGSHLIIECCCALLGFTDKNNIMHIPFEFGSSVANEIFRRTCLLADDVFVEIDSNNPYLEHIKSINEPGQPKPLAATPAQPQAAAQPSKPILISNPVKPAAPNRLPPSIPTGVKSAAPNKQPIPTAKKLN